MSGLEVVKYINDPIIDLYKCTSTSSASASLTNALLSSIGVLVVFTVRGVTSLLSVEERLAHYKKNEVVFEEKINILNFEVKLRDNSSVKNTKKLEKAEKETYELKLTLEKFQNSSKFLNNLLENQENVKSRSDKGYYAVPPPYIGNYIPPKPHLIFIDEQVESESVDVVSNVASSDVKTVESKHEYVDVKNKGVYNTVETKPVRKNNFSPPIIEDWNYDFESEVEFKPKVERGVTDRGSRTLKVSQSRYVQKILNNYIVDNGKSVSLPLGAHFKVSLKDCPSNDWYVERMSKVPCANVVCSLMYLMVCTRPDIAYVSIVSRYLANLDYAKDPDKGRSITGYVFMVHGCVVSWKATLQHVVAEAEYMALTEAVKESILLK
nr:retrotransposon protein, putative, Ty1-copia subclass [Tanacetum cinerariifolium]